MKWKKLPHRLNLKIRKSYKSIFKKLRPALDVKWGSKRKRKLIKNFFNNSDNKKYAEKVAKEISKIQLNNNKQEFKKWYKLAKSKNLSLPPIYKIEQGLFKELVEQNLKMIKSIPKRIFKLNKLKYVKLVQKQVLEGTVGRGVLEKFLDNLGTKYSKTIARTEISKLQVAVQEKRSKSLGCKLYMWSSTHDKRTRKSHTNMNNVVIEWTTDANEKPHLDKMTGHAGEFPNCRCFPEPVFDEKDLPNGAMIKFYNYKKHKIEKISRTKFINEYLRR